MSLTKEDLRYEIEALETRLGSKFATKQELAEVRTEIKKDIADIRIELKQDIADVKVELVTAMTTIAEDLKRHFDFSVEQIRSDRNDAVDLQLEDHEHRIQQLEATQDGQ